MGVVWAIHGNRGHPKKKLIMRLFYFTAPAFLYVFLIMFVINLIITQTVAAYVIYEAGGWNSGMNLAFDTISLYTIILIIGGLIFWAYSVYYCYCKGEG